MADRTAQGREFLKGVLQHLPDDLRGGMEQYLGTPEATQVLNYAGDGALRHNDFASQSDKLRTDRAALDTWAKQLDDYRKTLDAAAAGTVPITAEEPPVTTPATAGLSKDDVMAAAREIVNTELARRENHYANFTADAVRIGSSHLKQFGTVLDARAVLAHPKLGELGFEGAYRDLYKSEFDTAAAADAAKARETLKNELRQELQAERSSPMPYPLGEDDSPLASLGQAPDKYTVDAAVRHYNQLVPGSSH